MVKVSGTRSRHQNDSCLGIWGKAMATVIQKTRKRRQDLREGGHKPDFCEPRKAQGLEEHAGPQEELLRSTWPLDYVCEQFWCG